MAMLPIIYKNICPIDKGRARLEEIEKYGFCSEHYRLFKAPLWEIRKNLECSDRLGLERENCLLEKEVSNYQRFFKDTFGFEPSSINIYWLKKVLRHESFTIMAPTGFGKTTFGIAVALFFNKKVYYLVPSKILLAEIENKFKQYNFQKRKVLVVKDDEDKRLLKEGDFEILITTSYFLHRNYDLIQKDFDIVFIDDADSLIRQPKNIDKILKLIRVTDTEIESALNIIKQKSLAKNKEDFLNITPLKINKLEKGIIIAASATLTPKTRRINLFKEILGFEIGQTSTHLRNIEDTYEIVDKSNIWQKSVYWIKKLGCGGFVFLSSDYSLDDLNRFLEFLEMNSIKAISYQKFSQRNKQKFINGEYHVVVGFSNIRNPLARGIDLPATVRYALFIGVPNYKINLELNFSPLSLFIFGLTLLNFIDEEHQRHILEKHLRFLKKISYLSEEQIKANEKLFPRINEIRNFLEFLSNSEQIKNNLIQSNKLSFEFVNNKTILKVSDPRGYIQASGRTSRLFPLGLTKGLALTLVDDYKVFNHLQEKLLLLGYQVNFKDINKIELNNLLGKIDNDRRIVKEVIEGKEYIFKNPIETALVLVESPTKAKTIAKFFGRPARRIINKINIYEVSLGNITFNITASLGHVVDLTINEGEFGVINEKGKFVPVFQPLKICADCGRHLDFESKNCDVCQGVNFISKEEVIETFQKLATEVDYVLLATDPDAEGERIALDLFAYLYPFNKKIYRIEMHEITKNEFLKQINNRREIDINLVKAQLVRRISDRWIGFSLSQEVQRKFQNLALSAGRVQTPVLGWLISKYERSRKKKYLIIVKLNGQVFYLETDDKGKIKKLKKNGKFHLEIKFLKKTKKIIKPLPPYTTSELLKDASLILKLSSEQAMKLAQNLFELGFITYHRTDSIFVSEAGKFIALDYLRKNNIEDKAELKNWGKIGAHECIRPTRPIDVKEILEGMFIGNEYNLSRNHLRLYSLILNRFLSSQMKNAEVIWATYKVKIGDIEQIFENPIQIIKDNHLIFYKRYPVLNLNEGVYEVQDMSIKRVPVEFPYSHGTIIDEMKKKGLGRPSTYATVIQTILERNYAISIGNYLVPTKLGKEIYQFLIKRFSQFVSEEFTKQLEKNMDLVETNKRNYQTILKILYNKLKKSFA